MILSFPVLAFQPGENITIRMGSELSDAFGGGDTVAEIYQLGNPTLQGHADISMVVAVPFSMIKQEWIDDASYPGIHNLDDLYNYMSQFYGTFDCDADVAVIYFTPRS